METLWSSIALSMYREKKKLGDQEMVSVLQQTCLFLLMQTTVYLFIAYAPNIIDVILNFNLATTREKNFSNLDSQGWRHTSSSYCMVRLLILRVLSLSV